MAGQPPVAEIRPYRSDDRDGFARLVESVLAEYGLSVDPELERDLDDPAAAYEAVWVMQDGAGEVCGSVALRREEGYLYLKRMYLVPSARGEGWGRRLLEVALDHARASGVPAVELDTAPEMEAARRLYESAGFTESGSRTERGARDARCQVLYRLELGRPSR